jgi:hypothetical protein
MLKKTNLDYIKAFTLLYEKKDDEEKVEEAIETYLDPKKLMLFLHKNSISRGNGTNQALMLGDHPLEIIINALIKHTPQINDIPRVYQEYAGAYGLNRADFLNAFNNAMERSPFYGEVFMSYAGKLYAPTEQQPGKQLLYKVLQTMRDKPIDEASLNRFYSNIDKYKTRSREFTSDPRDWVNLSRPAASSSSSSSAEPIPSSTALQPKRGSC